MPKVSSQQAWIETGYSLFAKYGLEGIQVEPLARALGMNKSGFYHYFGDRDSFLESMMQYHVLQGENIAAEYKKIEDFERDYINVLMRYPTPMIVHMQLVRNKHIKLLNDYFTRINMFVDQGILPHWADYVGLSDNMPLALQYFEMIRDTFYSRVTIETYRPDFILRFVREAKQLVAELRQKNLHPEDFRI
jgi:AcrR family transcriptional regulator